jgi:hypothetical protein
MPSDRSAATVSPAPLFWMVDGVVFLDVGNVFMNVSDFSLTT